MTSEKQHREFEAMLGRCNRTVFKVCWLFTDRSREQVEDTYQEVVSCLWDSYSHFRNDSEETTWVYRVALNTVLYRQRRLRRQPLTVQLDEALYCELERDTHSELVNRLYSLIDRLSPDEKEMVFFYLDRVPQKEVARIKRCSERKVRYRMQEIINKLKKMNEDED